MSAATPRQIVPRGLTLEGLSAEPGGLTIRVAATSARARCPACRRGSARTHSRYERTVADLPWQGIAVTLKVRARRFFCDEPSCGSRIFCERLPDVAAHARKTDRLGEALLAIVLELGGRAGARLAAELGLVVGRDALLSHAKNLAPEGCSEAVRVLGVDDFAFRKGNAYGTILVDLERRRVVDLLPECSQESLANWLRQHPGVEVATRDRSRVYREGIAKGAPRAAQVADRWHLLRSLALGLEEFLLHKRPALGRAAAPGTDAEEERPPGSIDDDVSGLPVRLGRPYGSVEGPALMRHERLVERWKEVRRLHLAGASVKDIAEWVGTSQSTVYRYRELAEPPPRPRYKRRASVLDPYLPYLLGRWNEGCRSAKRLHQEIREMGYRHSVDTVNRLLSSFRYTEQQGKQLPLAPKAKRGSIAGASPTAKNVAALFMRREEMLSEEQEEYLERLCASDPAVAEARRLTQEFAGMVRGLEGEKLDGWLQEAAACEASVMKKFAAGLKKDSNRSGKHGWIVCVFFQGSVVLLPYDYGIDGERQREAIMRKIVVTEFMSLDGVMEEPRWTFEYWNDEIANFKGEESSASDALLLGRVTYQGFAAAWPQSKAEGADYFNSVRKYVVSETLEEPLEWNNSTLIRDNIVEQITSLKQQDGEDITVHGSATLVQHDLVDGYRLLVYPVVLGKGKRLFRESIPATLNLLESQSFSSGVVALVYEPDRQ
jgi:transposase